MRSTDTHPTPDTLESLVAGRLDKLETDAVIAHLSECEACLSIADGIWHQHLDDDIPDLTREATGRMESILRRRIHRSELGGEATRLGTQGLLLVIMALLRPLFGRQTSKRSSQ